MYLSWKYEVIYGNDVNFRLRISHLPILETVQNVRDFIKLEGKEQHSNKPGVELASKTYNDKI